MEPLTKKKRTEYLSDDETEIDEDYIDNVSFCSENNFYNASDSTIESLISSQWSTVDADPEVHAFIEKETVKVDLSPNSKPLDFFLLLFDDILLEKIVNWTNSQAMKLLETTHISKDSYLKNWSNVTIDEFERFLGLCIMMGNIHMPNFKSYWSNDSLYYHPLFGQGMCRNRFETILRCLKFYDDTCDKSSRLHKIEQVMNHLIGNIQKVYYPGENLSLDEGLLLWRGRLQFRQYIPLKKAKFGIKTYELCTPDGFVLNFFIYCGKDTVHNENGHAYSVVYKLLQNYLGKWHTVYMDNYYNSVQLAASLYGNKTKVVGTLRKNRRGNPKFVVEKKLKKGESIFAINKNILVQKWKDKREVLTISTKHNASFQDVTSKRGIITKKPSTIVDYNKNMSGIDRSDQMIAYYSSPRKSLRWYIKFFFHIMDIAIWNSCWLYNKTESTNMNYLQFRNEIARQLLGISRIKKAISLIHNNERNHCPKKLSKRVRCRVCSARKVRKDTFFACDTCKTSTGKPVGLCVNECFKLFHLIK